MTNGMPTDKGEQRGQAVAREGEGQVLTTAPVRHEGAPSVNPGGRGETCDRTAERRAANAKRQREWREKNRPHRLAWEQAYFPAYKQGERRRKKQLPTIARTGEEKACVPVRGM